MPQLLSSALSWVEYDPNTRRMEITFRSGRTYTLTGVPAHHYQGLLKADSPGWYFNHYLRGNY